MTDRDVPASRSRDMGEPPAAKPGQISPTSQRTPVSDMRPRAPQPNQAAVIRSAKSGPRK